ncbi:MAG: permease-like cell division protein FtsX [Atribacterota bacterium]
MSIFFTQLILNLFIFGYLELDKMREMWKGSFTLRAFFVVGTPLEKIQEVQQKIEDWAAVKQVVFVDAEEARRRFLQYFALQEEDLPGGENPFPASLEVLPERLEDLPKLAAEMKKIPVFDEVVYGGKNVEELLRFHRFFVGAGGVVILGVFIFVLLLIGSMVTLKVRFHQEEIRVLRLLGATNRQIRASFLGEGVLEGFLGGMTAFVVSSFFFRFFLEFLEASFPAFFWVRFADFFLPLFLINVFLSGILSMVGTFVAVNGVLKEMP